MGKLSKPIKTSKRNYIASGTFKKVLAASKHFSWITILSVILLLVSPTRSAAIIQKYNVVTDEFYGLNAERILLVPFADAADKTVLMTGKCTSRAATDLYLENGPENAKEKWFIITNEDNTQPDQKICITGNLPAWFEKTASLH